MGILRDKGNIRAKSILLINQIKTRLKTLNGENKQKTREAICSIRKIAHLTLKLHFLLQSNLTLYIKGIQRIKRVL